MMMVEEVVLGKDDGKGSALVRMGRWWRRHAPLYDGSNEPNPGRPLPIGDSRPGFGSLFEQRYMNLYPNPACLARRTACARSTTCNLLKMLETWLLTVFGLSTSSSAISTLLW